MALQLVTVRVKSSRPYAAIPYIPPNDSGRERPRWQLSGAALKKPKMTIDQPPAAAPVRADLVPQTGFSLVVDGHFKSHYDNAESATDAATALKARYPMLQIQVYDAVAKTRAKI